MINILDFGAVADGKTLCTDVIQRAVDAGDVIYIPTDNTLLPYRHIRRGVLFGYSAAGIDCPGTYVILHRQRSNLYNWLDDHLVNIAGLKKPIFRQVYSI